MACLCCAARRTKPTPPALLAQRLAVEDPFAHVPGLGELVKGKPSPDRLLKLHGSKESLEGDPSDPETEVPLVSGSKVEQEKQVLEDVIDLASKLAGEAQKYPKSGIGFLSRAQDRYFAVIPGEGSTELRRWKDGRLGWWDNESSYKHSKSEPKDYVLLFKIQKVHASKDSDGVVNVKHKVGKESVELVLRFESKPVGDQWAFYMWELIAKLRGFKD
mmetsp:Transcript_73189/g.136780  ORF Transcript_73189/g.136780 Transcript_73189/m.136780 type:complete len:217 (-) Transcript_73189:52-702(-)